jgi:CheY-like chemotaxis protein
VKVLIVEDEPDIRGALAELLRGEGMGVLSAGDAREALSVLHSERPDVILLDLLLPGVGGRPLLAYLQLMPTLCDIPVIVMTASAQRVEGRPCLAKPFTLDEALEAIRSAVGEPRLPSPA